MGSHRLRDWAIGLSLLGTLATVLAPRLGKAVARADEAEAIGDSRRVAAAEEAYAGANQGYYADLIRLCRAGNGECEGIGIPSYIGPDFLTPDLGRVSPYVKGGTIRAFTADGTPESLSSTADPTSVRNYTYDSVPETLDYVHLKRAFSVDSSGIVYEDVIGAQIPCPIPIATREAYDNFRRSLAVDFGRRGLWLYDPSRGWSQISSSDPALVTAWRDGIAVSFETRRGLWAYDADGWIRLSPFEPTLLASEGERLFAAFAGQGLWSFEAAGSTKIEDRLPSLMEPFGSGLAAAFGPGEGVSIWFPLTGWRTIRGEDPYLFREIDGQLVTAFRGQGVTAFPAQYVVYLDEYGVGDWMWWPVTDWEPERLSRFRQGSWGGQVTGDYGQGRGIWVDGRELEASDPYLLVDHDGALVAAFHSGLGLRIYEDANGWRALTPWEPTSVVSAETYLAAAFDGKGLYRYDADSGWVQLRDGCVESMVAVRLEGRANRGRGRRRSMAPTGRGRRRLVP